MWTDRCARPARRSGRMPWAFFALFGRRYCDRYCAALLAMLSTNIAAVCGRAAMCEEHARPGAPGSQADGEARRRVERPSVEGPSVEGPSVEPRLVVVPAGGWLGAVAVHEPQSIVAARLGGANDRKASVRGRPPCGADAIKSEIAPSTWRVLAALASFLVSCRRSPWGQLRTLRSIQGWQMAEDPFGKKTRGKVSRQAGALP